MFLLSPPGKAEPLSGTFSRLRVPLMDRCLPTFYSPPASPTSLFLLPFYFFNQPLPPLPLVLSSASSTNHHRLPPLRLQDSLAGATKPNSQLQTNQNNTRLSISNQVKMPRSPAENNSAAGAAADGQAGAPSALTINGVTLTALETKFMVNMVATLEAKPVVNWEKLADIMGVKGKKSAFERWRLIRHKFSLKIEEAAAAADASGADTPTGTPAKKAATPRARKTAAAKTATAASASAANSEAEAEGEEDAAGTPKPAPVTPAKRGRKPAGAAAAKTPAGGRKRAAASASVSAASTPAAGAAAGGAAVEGDEVEEELVGTPAKKARKGKAAAAVVTKAKKAEVGKEDATAGKEEDVAMKGANVATEAAAGASETAAAADQGAGEGAEMEE